MPRTYLTRDDSGTHIQTSDKASGGSKAEKFLLGNTDFDAINNPLTGFNFVLEVEAVYFLALKSVRAFTKENEFEYIREGGVNDYVHLKRKPISKPFTFQIERYVGNERFLDPLALGTELVLPLALYVYRHKAQQGWSSGAWASAMPGRVYLFTGCTVMSKEYGELDAEKSGLLTETTTISYRELVAITNPFDNSEKPEWNFNDYKNTDGSYNTKYAAFANNDKTDSGTYPFEYTTDAYGNRVIKRKDSDIEHHAPWDGTSGAKVKWSQQSGPDKANATYKEVEVEGRKQIVRVDKSDFNRAQYELKKDKDTLKYATEAYEDKNASEKRYDITYDDEGIRHVKRVDHVVVNKNPWDGTHGAVPTWAKQAGPDKNNTTYKVDTKDGVTTITRKDSSQFNKPQYELKKDKRKQKYSQVAYVDQDASSPIYKVDGDTVTRVDKSMVNRPQYELKKNRQKPKYAQVSPTDSEKPEQRPQYEYKKDGAKNKYAAISPRDSETPEQRPQYEYKKDGINNKYAKKPARDSEKPEQKPQYEYSKDGDRNKYAKRPDRDTDKPTPKPQYELAMDGVENKYARRAENDDERPTPVIWPPTRRAMMADALKR